MDQDEIIKLAVSYTKEHNKVYSANTSTPKVYFEVETDSDNFVISADKVLGYDQLHIRKILERKKYKVNKVRRILPNSVSSSKIFEVSINGNNIPEYIPAKAPKKLRIEKDPISKFLQMLEDKSDTASEEAETRLQSMPKRTLVDRLENFTSRLQNEALTDLGLTKSEFEDLASKKKSRPKYNILNKNIGK
jgi:hypothetical protein